jgi:glucokinase
MSERPAAIGLDVGGTKIAAGRLLEDGRWEPVAVVPTVRGDGEANAVALRDVLRRCGSQDEVPVGLSLTTTVDDDGRLRDVSGWLGWAGRRPAELVGRPARSVFAANDAACGAMAESTLGAAAGQTDPIFVTLGTGLSHTATSGGVVLTGAHGAALFSGYVAPGRCDLTCEAETVEDVVAGPGLARAWRGGVDARGVLAADAAGDASARAVVKHAAGHLADYLAMLVTTYDPSVVVIGGGLGVGAPHYVGEAVTRARTLLRLPFMSDVAVVPAALGPDAGWLGAALMARGSSRSGARH